MLIENIDNCIFLFFIQLGRINILKLRISNQNICARDIRY